MSVRPITYRAARPPSPLTRRRLLGRAAPASALARRSTLPGPPAPHWLGVGNAAFRRLWPARRLQQLQGLHVDQVLVLAGDVGVAHRLEDGLFLIQVDAHPEQGHVEGV